MRPAAPSARAVLGFGLVCAACSGSTRDLQIVPQPSCAGAVAGKVNAVQVTGLGDFPPAPASVASVGPSGMIALSLPSGTRVIEVDGVGAGGNAAFGRTAPLELGQVFGANVPLAYGPPDGLCPTGKLSFARAGHRATLLPSGDVVFSGGVDSDGAPVGKLELYATTNDLFGPAAAFRVVDQGGATALDPGAALGHAVAVLANGDFLIIGGAPAVLGVASGIAFAGVTHHGPDGTIIGTAGLLGGGARAFHSATTLADGRVAVVGGCAQLDLGACAAGQALASTTIYDPHLDQWSAGPALLAPRWDHDAILRGDGSIVLVGGRDAAGAPAPVEIYDPDENRPIAAGLLSGRGAPLPTGAVAVIGDAPAWWLGASESTTIDALPAPRTGHTVTALEDGALLVAGGGDAAAPLVVYDGRGRLRALDAIFPARGHTATRLGDGTVLLAGGSPSGAGSTDAFVFLRSPLGPFTNVSTITFDRADDPWMPRRPDRVGAPDGRLHLTAPMAGESGRPGELALLAALDFDGLTLSAFIGRDGPAGAALIFGWKSDAEYAFVSLEEGVPVTLSQVTPGVAGQSVVATACTGGALQAGELPDGDLAPVSIEWRAGLLRVGSPTRLYLQCSPKIDRGQVGLGALHGTVLADTLAVSR